MRSTVKERILLHLANHVNENHQTDTSHSVSQKGIMKAVGASRGYVSRALSFMVKMGWVEEEMKDVGKEQKRKLKVYRLTHEGREKAKSVRDRFLKKQIVVKKLDEEKKIRLKDIDDHTRDRYPLLRALQDVDEKGVLEINERKELDKISFVDRKEEISRLEECFKEVTEEGSIVLFISGVSGSGKTELCMEFKDRSDEKDILFLSGEARSELSKPFFPFIKAFGEDIDIDFKTISKASLETDDYEFFQAKKTAYFDDIAQRLREASLEKPIIIFLDDLQWADAASVELLKYLTKNLGGAPLLFLCNYRYEELSDDHLLEELKRELSWEDDCRTMILDNFDMDDSAELMFEITGDPALPFRFVKLLHRMSHGNPLFLKEFMRLLIEDGKIPPYSSDYPMEEDELKIPETLKNVIEKRLDSHISKKARRIVELCSVIGGAFSFELVSKIANIDEIDLLYGFEELVDKDILEKKSQDESFDFSHHLISQIAYERIPSWKKKKIHLLIAENIEEMYEKELEGHYSELARHHEKGKEMGKAVDYYIKAGKESENIFAHENTIDMYKKVIDLTADIDEKLIDEIKIIKKIARAYYLLGDNERSREYLAQAAVRTHKCDEKKAIYCGIAETYITQEDFDMALRYIKDGLALNEKKDTITCKLLSLKGWICLMRGDPYEAERIYDKEKRLAEDIGGDKEMGQVYHDLGMVDLTKNRYSQSIEKLKKAIDIRENIDDDVGLNKSYHNIAVAYKRKGDPERTEKYFKKSLKICEDVGYKVGLINVLLNLGIYQLNQGKWNQSLYLLKRSSEIAEELKEERLKALSFSNLSSLFLYRGDLNKSKRYIKKCKSILKKTEDDYVRAKILLTECALKKKEGKLDEAEEILVENSNLLEKSGLFWALAESYDHLGCIYHHSGDLERAKKCYDKAVSTADKVEFRKVISSAKSGIGNIELSLGEIEAAKECFSQGLEIAEELNEHRAMIQNLMGLGEVYLKMDETEKAEEYFLRVARKVEKRSEPSLCAQKKIAMGRLYLKKGDHETARNALKDALEESSEAGDMIWKARALYELGMYHVSEQDMIKAERYLKESLEAFEKIGMKRWQKKTERMLARSDNRMNDQRI